MKKYMEYTKGGDILIAPSLTYKHQYIFKCDLCEEFFGEFEHFFTHYLSHYEMESSEDDDFSPRDAIDKAHCAQEDTVDEFNNMAQNKEDSLKVADTEIQHTPERMEEETVSWLKEDYDCDTENVEIMKESIIEESQLHNSLLDVGEETLESVEHDLKIRDDQMENAKTAYKAQTVRKTVVEDKSTIEFVRKFMKSKRNVKQLIVTFKNEKHLWDFNLPVENRRMETRLMTWNKMATALRNGNDLDISGNQVAACILYLRQRFRERKRCGGDAIDSKIGNEILPLWVFKQLEFLNPFVESSPIGHLDIHQDLSAMQTTQLLDIFRRCSHLWDTSTFEYYCTNKRCEALAGMKDIIAEEMKLETDEEVLKTYISDVRSYVSLEKRQKSKTHSRKIKYKNHLSFLFDHVGPFHCSYCRHIKENPLTLKAHESQHDGTMPFKCPQCSKECKYVDSYINHMKRHMGDLNHECEICGKKFIRVVEVREHMRCHTGDKPFCCDICGSSFRQRTGFSMHMRRHIKKYISFCPFCSKGFYTKDSMQMHAKIHTDERDFVCPTCGKAFKTKRNLKSHIATHENGHYECNICGKSFKNNINLWQHKRKHRLKSAAHQSMQKNSPFLKTE